jgi:hypothetical protein
MLEAFRHITRCQSSREEKEMNFIRLVIVTVLVLCATCAVAGEYLGQLSENPYGPDSTSNAYGRYGSEHSPDSINNPYGAGSPYRTDSPTNPYGEGLSIYGNDDG